MINSATYFQLVDFSQHMDVCVQFREDSFRASYPDGNEWQQHWDEADYRKWIVEHAERFTDGAQHLWSNGNIIGQLEFAYWDERAHVNLFYLRPDKRGAGYGTLLQEHVTDYLRSKKCAYATLRVSPRNERAIRFYKKHGWVDTGADEQYPQVQLYRFEL